MMIKKQLSVLAGAVIAASTANAAFDAGSDALVSGVCAYSCWQGTDGDLFFWAHDSSDANGSFFYNLSANDGITVDTVLGGNAFMVMLGADLSLYDTWGVIGASHDVNTSYAYAKAGVALGAISSAAGPVTSATGGAENIADQITNSVNNWSGEINGALAGADAGAVGTGDDADKNNSGVRLASYFQGGGFADIQNVFFYGILDASNEPLFDAGAVDETVDIAELFAGSLDTDQGTAKLTFSTGGSEVPVPAAAWLFGSALLGLGVVRRKS